MTTALATPGYVYVLAHPELPAWHKVGRTYRPPHERARELSTTAWPTPFEVVHARFFWDSVSAERAAHQALAATGGQRKEFFDAPLSQIQAVVNALPQGSVPPPAPIPVVSEQDPWDAPWAHRETEEWAGSLDYRTSEWEQGEQELADPRPDVKRQGWRRWMRLSAEGWAMGSWDLAERLVQAHPGPEGALRASWVFEAAEAQGLLGGRLRAAWIRSVVQPDAIAAWGQALADTWALLRLRDPETWPRYVTDTLHLERHLVTTQPPEQVAPRAQADSAFGGWDRLLP